MQTPDDATRESAAFRYALQFLLVFAFITGGSSQISGWDDVAVQLVSLPILSFALWRLASVPTSRVRNVAMGVAGLIAMVPLLQLLPLPEFIWQMPAARQQLAADLAAAGAVPDYRWSLDPPATERAFLFLLPPLAVFAGMLTLPLHHHRRMLRLVMLLAFGSLLLAFLQLGVPRESVLNPYPEWAARFNGVFANQNHQGISIVVGVVIAVAGLLESLPQVQEGRRQAWTPWILGFLATFALCALPLTGSRGALLIAVLAVGAVPLLLGYFNVRQLSHGWMARIGLVACAVLILLGAWAAAAWMRSGAVDELRAPLRDMTFLIGNAHAPLGAGMGAFVPAFEQGAPDGLLLRAYINHAHNEYLQWWLEGGWIALVVMALVIAFLGRTAMQAVRSAQGGRAIPVAAALGLAALLLHSWVDYPLRTVSLATVAGVLAGLLVARASIHPESPRRIAAQDAS